MAKNVRKSTYRNVYGKGDYMYEEECTLTETTIGRAKWTTKGRGFGRHTGWLIPGKFTESKRDTLHIAGAFIGRRAVPGSGGSSLGHGRLLNHKDGTIVVQKKRCKVIKKEPL